MPLISEISSGFEAVLGGSRGHAHSIRQDDELLWLTTKDNRNLTEFIKRMKEQPEKLQDFLAEVCYRKMASPFGPKNSFYSDLDRYVVLDELLAFLAQQMFRLHMHPLKVQLAQTLNVADGSYEQAVHDIEADILKQAKLEVMRLLWYKDEIYDTTLDRLTNRYRTQSDERVQTLLSRQLSENNRCALKSLGLGYGWRMTHEHWQELAQRWFALVDEGYDEPERLRACADFVQFHAQRSGFRRSWNKLAAAKDFKNEITVVAKAKVKADKVSKHANKVLELTQHDGELIKKRFMLEDLCQQAEVSKMRTAEPATRAVYQENIDTLKDEIAAVEETRSQLRARIDSEKVLYNQSRRQALLLPTYPI
jgi:vacuolar-type H+-ATPase subunit I/STV1